MKFFTPFLWHFFKKLPLLVLSFTFFTSYAYEVPSVMYFAGIKLNIDSDARRQIQNDINAILRDADALNGTLRRCNLYIPLIEEILEAEKIPSDFKYLAIVKSKLIPTTRSAHDEVGFWQIPDSQALQRNLLIDQQVDQRMDILASTDMLAGYLHRNNLFFNNWLFTLLSYDMGYEGAKSYVEQAYLEGENFRGLTQITITAQTPSFLKYFLAHKIVYEEKLYDNQAPRFTITKYYLGSNKTLEQIAKEQTADVALVKEANQWLKMAKVPTGNFVVLIPFELPPAKIPKKDETTEPSYQPAVKNDKENLPTTPDIRREDLIPKEKTEPQVVVTPRPQEYTVEEKKTAPVPNFHIVQKKQTLFGIARLYNVSINDLRAWNNLKETDYIYAGQKLSLRPNTAAPLVHKVTSGQTLYFIARKYGVSVQDLMQYNQLTDENRIEIGQNLKIPEGRKVMQPSQQKSKFQDYKRQQNTSKILEKLDE